MHRFGSRFVSSRALLALCCLLAAGLTLLAGAAGGSAATSSNAVTHELGTSSVASYQSLETLAERASAAAITPAAGKIAYIEAYSTTSADVWTINPNGTGAFNVTKNPALHARTPALSPDGTKIAFFANGGSSSVRGIYVVNADGSGLTRVVPTGTFLALTNAWDPSWSPDGTKIAFEGRASGADNVYVLDVGGGAVTRITNLGDVNWSDWSPADDRIAFTRNEREIWTVKADPTDLPKQLTTAVGDEQFHWAPAWSPDGTKIAFVTLAPSAAGGNYDVKTVVSADGSSKTNLTPSSGYAATEPGWSPDGDQIVFVGNVEEPQTDLYIMNATTGEAGGFARVMDTAVSEQHSDWGIAPTTGGSVPGAPTGVTAVAGDAQATVSWTPPASDGGSAITNYVVTPFIGEVAQTPTEVGNVTSTPITGLTNGTTYTFKVAAKNAVGTGPQSASSNAVTPTGNVEGIVPADFDGDGTTDESVFRPGNGFWYVSGGDWTQWGVSSDVPVPGDYNDDNRTEVAVWRPSDGFWYVNGGPWIQWGQSGDVPVPGDYDGNGSTDIAVWRPSDGVWYVNGGDWIQWGQPGDIPVPGDYNGDNVTDIAVWRPSSGVWYVRGGAWTPWGQPDDVPVPGDYDDNGTTDVAVWRPADGFWYVHNGSWAQWGQADDIPVPGDYNGDGQTDIAVWRPGNGFWYVRGGAWTQWGQAGDKPLPPLPSVTQLHYP